MRINNLENDFPSDTRSEVASFCEDWRKQNHGNKETPLREKREFRERKVVERRKSMVWSGTVYYYPVEVETDPGQDTE